MKLGSNSCLALFVLAGCASQGTDTVWEPPTTTGGQSAAATGGAVGSSGGSEASGGATTDSGGESSASGGGSSGGLSGGANTGGAASGGQSGKGCEAGEYLLCDGFEDGSIDTSRWMVQKNNSDDIVEITSEQAARGSYSVHISTQNGYGFLKNQSVFPVPNNDYFGRMFLRVEKFSQVDWAHWTIAEAAGNGDGSLIRVGGQYDTSQQKNRWGVGSDGGPTGDWTNHDADPSGAVEEPPEGQWVCVEWEHKGSLNETRFFVDGTEHPSLATTATDHGGNGVDYVLPEMTSLWFGWYQYQDDSALRFEVWIDELAIDDQRIGCE